MNDFFTFFKLPQASTLASEVDWLYDVIFWISVIGFLGVVIPMIFFSIKYRRNKTDPEKTPHIEGHTPTELGVSFILLVVVMLIFYWGWSGYKKMSTFPKDALEIQVVGYQWGWDFYYGNGRKEKTTLLVPKDTNVKLTMTSDDVVHSFYIPAFRLKNDVLPKMYSYLWFKAPKEGEFDIFCAEYCGLAHSRMIGKVKVLPKKEYEKWHQIWMLEENHEDPSELFRKLTLAEQGEILFKQKKCISCHYADKKEILVGPPLLGVFGRQTELQDGSKMIVDENYIRESLMDPTAKVVKGFPPVMTVFKGLLTNEEINALIAYLKSLQE